MELVSAQRFAQWIAIAPSQHPGFIGPLKLAIIPDYRRIFGGGFEEESVRIRLQHDPPLLVTNFKLVMGPFANIGDKDLPNAGESQRSHLMDPPIPRIEIPHHADALGV